LFKNGHLYFARISNSLELEEEQEKIFLKMLAYMVAIS
jgi:hypothetical protein